MTAATEAQKRHRSIDKETYLNPPVPSGVGLTHVPLVEATNESLKEVGCIVTDPDDFTVESGRFEIVAWHNAVYVTPENGPATIFGRQGRVHPRISVRWADEFNTVLRVPLTLP